MIVLAPGLWDIKEIIEWFGIERETYWNLKQDYLRLLRKYCKYKLSDDGQKIQIIQVYVPLYNPSQRNRKIVRFGRLIEELWCKSGIDTIDNIYMKIIEITKDYSFMKRETIIRWIFEYLDWAYGDGISQCGMRGNCYQVLCNKIDKDNIQFLSKEEQKLFGKLFSKYFGDKIIETLFFVEEFKKYRKMNFEDMFMEMTGFNEDNRAALLLEYNQITGKELCFGISLVKFEEETDEEEIEELMRDSDGIKRAL